MSAEWSPTADGMWLPHAPVPQIGGGRRILHIATRFLRGGAERNIAHSVAWERAAGFEVELAFGPDADVDGIPEAIPTHRVSSLVRRVGPRDVAAVRQVRELIRSGRYDIVHTHLSKAGIIGRLAARGVADRVIHTVHMSSFGPGYSRAASAVYRSAERACAPIADVMVFVGSELRDQYVMAGVVDRRRTEVIRSPIHLEPFFATRKWSDERRREARTELGVAGTGPLVISIGTLEPRKRHDLVIRHLARWLAERPAHLVIVGEGPLGSRLLATVSELKLTNRVSLMGHLRDVASPMAAADVVVHASAAEGVPQVVIQALAAGRPVVATQVSGLREVIDASVRVVERSGTTLAGAVDASFAAPGVARPMEAFEPWGCSAIDGSTSRLYKRLAV